MTRSHKAAPMVVAPLDVLKFAAKSGGQVTYQQVQEALKVREADARRAITNCKKHGWLKPVKALTDGRMQASLVTVTELGNELLADFGYEPATVVTTAAKQGVNPFHWRNFSSDLMLVH